jgi:hypothetical protein
MNLRNLLRLVFVLSTVVLVFSMLGLPASAQSAAAGTVTGTVVDPQGAVISRHALPFPIAAAATSSPMFLQVPTAPLARWQDSLPPKSTI